MSRTTVAQILRSSNSPGSATVKGWVRTKRDSKAFSFIEINDGSSLANLQIIVDATIDGYETSVHSLRTGASIAVEGEVVASQGKQKWEMQAASLMVLGNSDEDYPLQKKGHSPEFLRSIAHLRPRTNLFGAVFRMRSRMAYAIHNFFQQRGFVYVHTPIITASDCEGAGEMFRVTTLDGKTLDKSPDEDFFGKPAYLTVSGQLEGETFACALSNIYTFGPTFRAENSHTSRHASEFWMIEPEMAFCDLQEDMALAEEMIKYLVSDALENCAEDLEFLGKFVDKGLLERLKFVATRDFERISYTDAVELLLKSDKKFEYKVEYGHNLQSEHERYLTEEHFKCPVTVYDYPVEIKPFYMRRNDDEKTVAAMDLLVPGIGEIVGGSQREERLDVLRANIKHHDLSEEEYYWYVDLRRYGSVPHAGFGLGFERLLMFVTGVSNIRDVIPFPRVPGSAEF
ncbi:MAG: asparagine--tRNA ligase [Verrucomicrobiales bacterium]|nr:asparagine--tRNA ligase [Verrucomicrobiales bacterium]